MRGFFGFLGFVAVLIVLVAAFAVPALVGPMVAASVRAASPFGSQPLEVQVDVDALSLIRGFVREIHVSGSNLEVDGATIESLDVRVRAVGIGDHAFQETLGGLGGVAISTGDGAVISVRQMALMGPSTAFTARATMDRPAAVAFIQHQFEAQGVAVTDLALTAGGIAFVIFGQRVDALIGVQDGALVIPDLLGGGPMELLVPLEDDPWRLTGATVSTNGLVIDASVDLGGLLGSG